MKQASDEESKDGEGGISEKKNSIEVKIDNMTPKSEQKADKADSSGNEAKEGKDGEKD